MRLYKSLWPQVQHLKAFWGLQDLIPMSLLHKASIWSWLLKGGSSPLLLWFLHKFLDDLVTWQLASPRAQDSKEMNKQSFLWSSLGTHCYICPIFYSQEGSHWVSCTFKGKELGSAFGRNKHERICKHILKLPYDVPVIFAVVIVQWLSRVWLLATPWMQHARLPCLSLSSEACSNSCPLIRWCHPTISSSVTHFSRLQSVPASGCFPVWWPKY